MRVQFQCTYDDFREANRGHNWTRSSLVRWLVFSGITVALISITPMKPVNVPDGRALTIRFLNTSLFTFIVCLFYGLALVRTALRRPRAPWLPPPRGERWTIVLLVAILAAVVLIFRLIVPERSSGSSICPSGYEELLSVLPCVLFVLMISAYTLAYRRLDLKRRWEGQVFLHRPCTLEADDAGITLEEPKSINRYHWDYFPGFRETLNTLLLYMSPYGFWVIPKRALASTEELEAFKALLITHVKTGMLRPSTTSGFPVVVLPPAMALPAQEPAEVQSPSAS